MIWSNTEAADYVHDIAGIGRDDLSGLNQRQSTSQNQGVLLTIGLDDTVSPDGLETTNATNDGVFTANKSFLIWSSDGAVADDGDGLRELNTAQVNSRLRREWRVQETGTVPTVTMSFDISSLAGPSGEGTNDEAQIVLLLILMVTFVRELR